MRRNAVKVQYLSLAHEDWGVGFCFRFCFLRLKLVSVVSCSSSLCCLRTRRGISLMTSFPAFVAVHSHAVELVIVTNYLENCLEVKTKVLTLQNSVA